MSKRVYINNDDTVYVPFRVANIKSKFSCLVPKKSLSFIIRNKKKISVECPAEYLYIADAKTPQVLIDLSIKKEESLFRAASMVLGHECDKTIDTTYKIIQREFFKIKLPIEINDFVDEVYETDMKTMTAPMTSRELMCDFNTAIYD